MRVKIGIDYTAAIHQSAGIGRYTCELIKALAVVPNNGSSKKLEPQYRLFVANAGKDFSPPLPGDNFAWCPTPFSERWLARFWYRLHLPINIQYWTGSLDLFHASDFVLPPVQKGTRTIVTIHDLSFVREPESVMPGMSAHLNKWVPRSVARADHVIAVSKATRQDLIDLYRTPSEKISVLYHGVTPAFKPVRAENKLNAVRHKYNLGEQPFVLSVGTIQPRKNYKGLIKAFAGIDKSVSLVIAGGKGWHYEEIYDEVTKQGLERRVHFPGFVADADLPGLYSAATLFVYPSLYEGFGLPVLEAMACGTPVIAANTSSLPEVVGEAGVLVNPRDIEAMATMISRILTDIELQQQLSQAGREQAKKFIWADMATQLLDLYQKMTEPKHL